MRKLLNLGIAAILALAAAACGDSGTDKAMAPPPSASEEAPIDKKLEGKPQPKKEARVPVKPEEERAAEMASEEAPAAIVEETEEMVAAEDDAAPDGAAAPEAEIAAVPDAPPAAAVKPPAAANGKPATGYKPSARGLSKNGGQASNRRSYKRTRPLKKNNETTRSDKSLSKKFGAKRGAGFGTGGGGGAGGAIGGRGLAPAAPPLENPKSLPAQPPVADAPPPAATPAPAAPDSSVALESLPPAPAAPSAPAAAAKPDEEADWSVVPIFFGTDRYRTDTATRVAYDWKRGRRLELGRALVTVPKKHEVPMVERPWAIKIPYLEITLYEEDEDPKEHFTLKDIKVLTKEEFLAKVREKLAASERFKDHALVFVHGYKTKFDNAIYRTAQIAYDLKFDGATFLYSWPSGGTLQGYTYDRESAAQAEPYLRDFLELVRDDTGAKKLSVIAHSMGNQPLLRVLQDLKRSLPEGVLISQLILAAPDVDRDSFENIVSSIKGIAEGITLYAAANDTALQVSRQVNGGVPRAGDVPEGGPIVIEGIDTIDATATSMDSVGINHSGYAENNALLTDIGKLIGQGVRPPEVRLPTLERVETAKGAYWRYPTANAQ